jgi:hypothetical protein
MAVLQEAALVAPFPEAGRGDSVSATTIDIPEIYTKR